MWLALLGGWAACSESSEPATQLVVWVSADAALTAELAAVRVELFGGDSGARDSAIAAHTFALAEVRGSTPPLSFSFGIEDSGPGTFTLAAVGCSDSEACEKALIEHKVRVEFERDKTLQLELHLDPACTGERALCPALDRTCRPVAEEPWRGACVEVPRARATPIHESSPRPLRSPMRAKPEPASDACAVENPCRDPYRCLARDDGPPICEGRSATWPMSDSLPDSRMHPRYDAVSTPGVVYDEITGLTWQRALPERYAGCTYGMDTLADACSWSEARDYCERLDLAGLHWRLPTFIELASLLDYRREILTLPLETFSITTQQPYWTASPLNVAEVPEPTQYFVWAFSTGRFGARERGSPAQVRCVHSEERRASSLPAEQYIHKPDEDLILDNYTNLVWHGAVVCRRDLSFAEAEDYCSGLSYRMRVPSLKELLTLVDPMVERAGTDPRIPHIAPLFTAHAMDGYFWSSTESKQFTGKYLLWFGNPDVQDETTLPSVRDAVDRVVAEFADADEAAEMSSGTAQSLLCARCVQ